MDARRSQVYTGLYRFRGEEFQVVLPQRAEALEEMTARLNEMGEPVILLGDGASAYEEKLKELLQVPWILAPAHLNRQRAGAVAALGAKYFAEGRTETAWEHKPEYLRLSQAERERREKEKEKGAGHEN